MKKVRLTIKTVTAKSDTTIEFTGTTVINRNKMEISGEFSMNTRQPSGSFSITNESQFEAYLQTIKHIGILD